MLTWADFEYTSKNHQNDFEDMCRLIFKRYYVKDRNVLLVQATNNPGIETETVNIDGVEVGFQAKYFDSKVSYAQLLRSAIETVKNYLGKIGKLIIFCNKNIDVNAETYIKLKKILEDNGIIIELFCNKNILDLINCETEYASIKALFFSRLTLTNDWFEDKLKLALDDLNPRYISGFHIENKEYQKHFDIFYRNIRTCDYLSEIISDAKKKLKGYFYYNNIHEKLNEVINEIVVPEIDKITDIFLWKEKFNPILQLIKNQKIEGEDVSDKRNELDKYIDIINSFNFADDKYFKYIDNNVMFIEGDAGAGKSHILGYEAEIQSRSSNNKTVLLLGQKFIFDETPEKQIVNMLDLTVSFDEFLLACEARGENDGSIIVIMIDAINECKNNAIWKNYLNKIIEKVNSYHHVKLICSVRRTYINYVLSEKLFDDLRNGKFNLISVEGFKNNLYEAIPLFFAHYNIPVTTSAYFHGEFTNPLFLKTYCEAYKKGDVIGSRGILSLYLSYIKKEEEKVKERFGIESGCNVSGEIINLIAEYLYNNDAEFIPRMDLYAICDKIPNANKYLDAFLNAKVFVSYCINEEENVFINYEKFKDYIVAKYIISKTCSIDELRNHICKRLFKKDKYGHVGYSAAGIFVALSVLAREKYKVEIVDCVEELFNNSIISEYFYQSILGEYITSYNYRADHDIDEKDYYNLVVSKIKDKESLQKHIENLICLAGRNCSLDINNTTNYLKNMKLSNRDYIWTININLLYQEGGIVYNIVNHFLNNTVANISYKEKLCYSQILIWFLTSSNRSCRDKASRALIRLLINDLKLMQKLLELFADVNDPYVISRLYGCVYGAILQTKDEYLKREHLQDICDYIYHAIFNKEIVYPDILLRDYALNILEYSLYKGVAFKFSIDKCRPPYKSYNIPLINVDVIKELYPDSYDEKRYGTYEIKMSMSPEYSIDGFTFSYGDFGRYVFESALNEFKNVNIKEAICYAYYYIIKILGYKDELFSDYDRIRSYGKGRDSYPSERIGKKYEWIVMYHVLALIADNYEYNNDIYDTDTVYKGTWRPYVRDFDPTILLDKVDQNYNLNAYIKRKEYSNWLLKNNNWAKIDDARNFQDNICIIDNNGDKWYALHFIVSDESGEDWNRERQSVFLMSTACLIKKDEENDFINSFKDKNFYGRWFRQAEVLDSYEIFAREYTWSPAFKDLLGNNGFQNVEISIGKKKIKKEVLVPEESEDIIDGYLSNISNDIVDIEKQNKYTWKYVMKEVEVEENEMKKIASILNCAQKYLWEEQYDYSKEETIHIVMPNSYIVEKLGLTQSFEGVWLKGDDVACADFNVVKNSNVNGLYIKDKYLRELLGEELSVIWIGLGEKQHTFGIMNNGKAFFSELSSFVYEKNGKLKEISIVDGKVV